MVEPASGSSQSDDRAPVLPKQPQPFLDDVEDDDEVFAERPLVFQGVTLPRLDEQAPPLDEKPPLEGPVVEAPFN